MKNFFKICKFAWFVVVVILAIALMQMLPTLPFPVSARAIAHDSVFVCTALFCWFAIRDGIKTFKNDGAVQS
jgi:uncharacterized membrane protein YhhN